MFRGRPVILERAIIILLLCAVISLPFFIHQSSAVAQHILTPSPTPTLPPPTNFSVTTVSLRDGSILPNTHPLQIPVAGVPLQVTGTYSSQGSGQVWVLVEDAYGQYYLQIPPVRFGTGGQ